MDIPFPHRDPWDLSAEDLPELPEWLRAILPEAKKPLTIASIENGVELRGDDFETLFFSSPEDAYDHARSQEMKVVFEGFPEELRSSLGLSVPSSSAPGCSRILLSYTEQDRLLHLRRDYASFLGVARRYHEDPTSFRFAYQFVVTHPAFWWRRSEEATFSWETSKSDLWLTPFFQEDGSHMWMLEAGAAIPPERTTHYHDLRLDSQGSTLEEAWISLAAKVAMVFRDDGTEREKVELERSPLELKLEEALQDLPLTKDGGEDLLS